MFKKIVVASAILLLLAALAACSGISIPGVAAASSNNGNSGSIGSNNQQRSGQNQFDPSKLPVDQKLAIGILKLEGTSLAVTADQAKTLLPLWQALEGLSSNQNTTTDEINALFQQMQDSLTKDQVNVIQTLSWKTNDLQALAQQYSIQMAQGGNFGNLTADQRATRVAQFQAQNGGNGARGGGGGGGFFFGGGPGGGGGGFGGGGNNGSRPTLTPQQQAQFQARRSLGGLNRIFAPAVIKLLQTKAGG